MAAIIRTAKSTQLIQAKNITPLPNDPTPIIPWNVSIDIIEITPSRERILPTEEPNEEPGASHDHDPAHCGR